MHLVRVLAEHDQSAQLGQADALVVLLTIETLLFAAFAVGAAFSEASEYGRPLPTSTYTFGRLAASAVTLVGVGSLAAWSDAYLNHGVHTPYQAIEASAILVGLVAEIGFAWWTAGALRDS